MGSSQNRAVQSYRARLGERGFARFEVLGREADRGLIRSLARQLAAEGPEASRLRALVDPLIAEEKPKKGWHSRGASPVAACGGGPRF